MWRVQIFSQRDPVNKSLLGFLYVLKSKLLKPEGLEARELFLEALIKIVVGKF